MQRYSRTSFCPRTLKHWGMLRRSRRVLIFLETCSTVAGVLDLLIILRSRMSGIGSLGVEPRVLSIDSTLRYFMQGTKYCHR